MNLGYETEFIEFKTSLGQLSRGLESIVAMLNKHGKGTIYFGVADNGDVVGLTIGNKTIKDVSDAINSRIKPHIIPNIKPEVFEGKIVLTVEFEGRDKPYSADGDYFIRSGNENKKMEPDILRDMVFTNTTDSITMIKSRNQDLTFNQIKQLYRERGLTIDESTFAQNMSFLCRDGEYNELADLLSDNNDCSIKVVRFLGKDKTQMYSRDEFGYQCLLVAMKKALEFVLPYNETKVDLSHPVREEIKLFDEDCLREAWYNACLHTRWDKMIPPAIYIFSDRIEIISTGGLPVDFPVEDFYKGISHPINRKLQQIMGQLGFVEQKGHGVPQIVAHYGKESFEINEHYINVVLKFPFNSTKLANSYSALNGNLKGLYIAISNNPNASADEYANNIGVSISTVNNYIKELKALGKIERVGSNKSGYWKVN